MSKVATKYALCDGLKIAYSDAGAGPAIVFLHGIGSTRDVWEPQLEALAERYRCIAVEYRGYGESEVPPPKSLTPNATDPQAISRAAFARDVFAVLDACAETKAHFCGLSLGGVVTFECFSSHPERVVSLALADTFAYYPRGVETLGERLKALVDLGMEGFAASRAPGIHHPYAPAAVIERARKQMQSVSLPVYLAATRATWTGDYRALLPKIDRPVLVVWGEYDRAVAPFSLSEEIALLVPDCRGLVTLPDAGHVSNVDNPKFFDEALVAFLNEI